jgi:glutaredoxin 3
MIEIYGKPACPFCEQAKQFCEKMGLSYTYSSMGTDFTREELLEKFPEARTVPQIIINGTKIGGYNELTKYIEETGYNGTGLTL